MKRLLLAGALLLAACGEADDTPDTPILTDTELARLRRLGPLGDPPPSPTPSWRPSATTRAAS